ncbi:TPA: hypothetical protein OW286_002316 [Citrobacter freundii]|nr:hypothetical protein [Citrobacter freundii]
MMCWSGKSIVDVLEWENIVDVLEREKHRWCAGEGKTSLVCWSGKLSLAFEMGLYRCAVAGTGMCCGGMRYYRLVW